MIIVVCVCCRGIVQCEEKLTISASWAKDEDISRLLQSLPNWASMTQPRQLRQKREEEEDFTRWEHMLIYTHCPQCELSTQIHHRAHSIYKHTRTTPISSRPGDMCGVTQICRPLRPVNRSMNTLMYSIRFNSKNCTSSKMLFFLFARRQCVLVFCLGSVLQRMKSSPYSLSRHLWTRTNSTAGNHTICRNIPASQTHAQFCFRFTCSLYLPPFLSFPLKCALELKKTQVWGKLWLDKREGGLHFYQNCPQSVLPSVWMCHGLQLYNK